MLIQRLPGFLADDHVALSGVLHGRIEAVEVLPLGLPPFRSLEFCDAADLGGDDVLNDAWKSGGIEGLKELPAI